jgi:hypothetical protein
MVEIEAGMEYSAAVLLQKQALNGWVFLVSNARRNNLEHRCWNKEVVDIVTSHHLYLWLFQVQQRTPITGRKGTRGSVHSLYLDIVTIVFESLGDTKPCLVLLSETSRNELTAGREHNTYKVLATISTKGPPPSALCGLQDDHLHMLYKFMARLYQRRHSLPDSTYCYGSGPYMKSHTFRLKAPTESSMLAVTRCQESRFSPEAVRERRDLAGSAALRAQPHPSQLLTRCTRKTSLPRKSATARWMRQYHLLEALHKKMLELRVVPPRADWITVLTQTCHNPSPAAPYCKTCRGCLGRVAQAAMVVFAAQGTSDVNILPALGAAFRHSFYRNYSAREWAKVSIMDLAVIFEPCSKQGISAHLFHFFINHVVRHGPPTTLEDTMNFEGFGMKSSCLFLNAAFGEIPGIPVDRHLKQAFANLGWMSGVPTSQKGWDMTAKEVQLWLPQRYWMEVNDVLCGIRQLYNNRKTVSVLDGTASKMGRQTHVLLHLLCNDIRTRKGGDLIDSIEPVTTHIDSTEPVVTHIPCPKDAENHHTQSHSQTAAVVTPAKKGSGVRETGNVKKSRQGPSRRKIGDYYGVTTGPCPNIIRYQLLKKLHHNIVVTRQLLPHKQYSARGARQHRGKALLNLGWIDSVPRGEKQWLSARAFVENWLDTGDWDTMLSIVSSLRHLFSYQQCRKEMLAEATRQGDPTYTALSVLVQDIIDAERCALPPPVKQCAKHRTAPRLRKWKQSVLNCAPQK